MFDGDDNTIANNGNLQDKVSAWRKWDQWIHFNLYRPIFGVELVLDLKGTVFCWLRQGVELTWFLVISLILTRRFLSLLFELSFVFSCLCDRYRSILGLIRCFQSFQVLLWLFVLRFQRFWWVIVLNFD